MLKNKVLFRRKIFKMKRSVLLVLVFCLIVSINNLFGCTTAVISGKYTKDGKPMLWKLRDTESFYNHVQYFIGSKYKYMALVNTDKTRDVQVWGGYNSTGFAIMNSASFNTNLDNPTEFTDQEGVIMKKALEECASLEDFENMLNSLPRPMGLNANFGVIDANGGAAYYETDNNNFVKFDANDPKFAPNGYIIRTNFSFTGKKDIGYGFVRYQTASELFALADAQNDISVKRILNDFSRSAYHSLTKQDYSKSLPIDKNDTKFVNTGDYITRHGSASNIIIEGVDKGEEPRNTVMWVNVAFPLTTPVVPVWMDNEGSLPKIVSSINNQNSFLTQNGLLLKDCCYSIARSSGFKYMNIAPYTNKTDGGIKLLIDKIEEPIFERAEKLTNGDFSSKDIKNYYEWLDNYVTRKITSYNK